MKKLIFLAISLLPCQLGFSQGKEISGEYFKKIRITADIVYATGYGTTFTLDCIEPPEKNGAAVLFMNSGGFESGKIRFCAADGSGIYRYLTKTELRILPEGFGYAPLAQYSPDELLMKGFTVFDIRSGSNPKFTIDEITEKCKSALSYIRDNGSRFHIDTSRLGIFGASSGGYLAAWLANSQPGIKSCVLYYPTGYDFYSLKNHFPDVFNGFKCLDIDSTTLAGLSLKNCIRGRSPATFIIYGDEDFPFITEDCRLLYSHLKSEGVISEIYTLQGTGHEFRGKDGYNTAYGELSRNKMVEWFEKTLK